MAIVLDAVSEKDGPGYTWTHTLTAFGSGRILVVGLAYFPAGAMAEIASGTYGGQALTRKAHVGSLGAPENFFVDLWFIVNPPTGANLIEFVPDAGACALTGMAISYTGVDTSNPMGTVVDDSALPADATLSKNATSQAGQIVIDVVGCRDVADEVSLTEGPGQVARIYEWSHEGAASARSAGGMSEEEGAATVTMSWTKPVGGSKYGRLVAVPLKPMVEARGRLVKCYTNTFDPSERILDVQGRDVPRGQVPTGIWFRGEGPFFITPIKHESLIEEKSVWFIESLRYNADRGDLNIEAIEETMLENLFRRMGQ